MRSLFENNFPRESLTYTIRNAFPPRIKDHEQRQFQELTALWIYTKDLPFTVLNDKFEDMVNFLRPSVKMPSREQLGGNLLNIWHEMSTSIT